MPKNYRGYMPLIIPVEVLNVAPKPVTQAWAQVTSAQSKYAQARDDLAIAEIAAQDAPRADNAAALTAVAEGKPIPALTEEATTAAVEAKRREIKALLDHVDSLESNCLSVLQDHRDSFVDVYYNASSHALEDAQAALTAANEAVARFTMTSSLWSWARGDDTGQPPRKGHSIRTQFMQDMDTVIDSCKNTLDRQHPDETLRAEANYFAEMEASRGRTTPDGLIKDAAAFAAYRY